MGFYAYCVVPAHHAPPVGLQGLNGSQVVAHKEQSLALWLSEIERPQPAVEAAKTHNAVVEAAVTEEVTPVPLRFGQWAPELEVIEQSILERLGWYEERLRAFAGALEFGVRAIRTSTPHSAQVLRSHEPITGMAYMEALRERAAAAQAERGEVERITAIVAEILGPHVRETKVEQPRSTHGLVNIVHLVARPCFDEYRAAVQGLKPELPELRFLLSGPWVPYSFAA